MTALGWSNPSSMNTPARAWRLKDLIPSRPVRVTVLVALIAVVSAADLYLTVLYLQNGGMSEQNPIARWVMSLNCGWILTAWKVLLAGGCCAILWLARHRWSSEVGSIIGACVMLWLGVRWNQYVDLAEQVKPTLGHMAQYHPGTWVQFTDR